MKIKKLIALMLSAMSLMGVFTLGGCISCKSEADRVEEKSFVDGYFKYYYINETDSYAIVGDGDVPYPETLAIPAYYNGKEVTGVYYHVATGIYFTGALGPSLENVKVVYYPFSFKADYAMTEFYTNNSISVETYYPDIVFCVNNESHISLFHSRGIKLYYTRDAFDKIEYTGGAWLKETFSDYKIIIYDNSGKKKHCEFQIANTSYMFNYKGAPNDGYFFINDFER